MNTLIAFAFTGYLFTFALIFLQLITEGNVTFGIFVPAIIVTILLVIFTIIFLIYCFIEK